MRKLKRLKPTAKGETCAHNIIVNEKKRIEKCTTCGMMKIDLYLIHIILDIDGTPRRT